MSSRGVRKRGAWLVTRSFTGVFEDVTAPREVLDALLS